MVKGKKGRAGKKHPRPNIAKQPGNVPVKIDADDKAYLKEFVRYRFNRIDTDGPWGWTDIPKDQMKDIYQKLGHYENLTWGDLNSIGKPDGPGSMHHSIGVDRLSRRAQERLDELRIEVEEVFSLRLTNIRRIYGLRNSQWLSLLWYDPKHADEETAVCPSKMRGT